MAAIANDESLQVRVRKSHPPEGRSSRHPSAKTGCSPTSRNAVSLQKLFCFVQGPCETDETVWTYPSTSLYKIGNVGHQQRELRFPLHILHCHSPPPACWEREAKALIPLDCEWRTEVGDPTQCLRFSLAVASWRCAYAPFPLRKHCWSLVQVLESLLSIDHWHRPAKLGAIELPTFVKGIGSGICPSPCFAFSLFACCSKLRATCKSASCHVKQE